MRGKIFGFFQQLDPNPQVVQLGHHFLGDAHHQAGCQNFVFNNIGAHQLQAIQFKRGLD